MTDAFAFNLMDRAWILCEARGGSLRELSLRDVLVQAHDVRGLRGESPVIMATRGKH